MKRYLAVCFCILAGCVSQPPALKAISQGGYNTPNVFPDSISQSRLNWPNKVTTVNTPSGTLYIIRKGKSK